MAVNKVIYGNDTLIDLTDDDVTAGDVIAGKYFHAPSGARTVGTATYAGSPTAGGNAVKTNGILYGVVDGTSTSTVFTATVDGLDSYYDGATVLLKNGVITSAAGFTININNLGAKPVYSNMGAASQESTTFNINYTILFVYDSTRVTGGCWIFYRGYYSDSNSVGFQIRTQAALLPAADKGYRYRLWFSSLDGSTWIPANTSTSTNATAKRTPNTRTIDPFGEIVYNSTNGTTDAGANLPVSTCWSQNVIILGYSFNTTGAALTLTNPAPVYLKCTPQSGGGVKMNEIVQILPSTEDGKVYIFLGMAYDATHIELLNNHPVYYYYNGAIRLWTNAENSALPATNTPLMDGSATAGISTTYARGDHVHPTDTSLGASLSISDYNLSLKNASNTTLNTVAIPHDVPFLMFVNTVVPVASFVSDQTYASFPYRAAIALTGVSSAMVPDVIFSVEDANTGAYSNISESYNGGIYIYADSVPSNSVTIPTIIAWNNG